MLTPSTPCKPISIRSGMPAVVDLALIPEDVVEALAAAGAVRAGLIPPGDYCLVLDADGLGMRATPLSTEHPPGMERAVAP